jgi:hypothetical protein
VSIYRTGNDVGASHCGEDESPGGGEAPIQLREPRRSPETWIDLFSGVLFGERLADQKRDGGDQRETACGDCPTVPIEEVIGAWIDGEDNEHEGDEEDDRAGLEQLRAAGQNTGQADEYSSEQADHNRRLAGPASGSFTDYRLIVGTLGS